MYGSIGGCYEFFSVVLAVTLLGLCLLVRHRRIRSLIMYLSFAMIVRFVPSIRPLLCSSLFGFCYLSAGELGRSEALDLSVWSFVVTKSYI